MKIARVISETSGKVSHALPVSGDGHIATTEMKEETEAPGMGPRLQTVAPTNREGFEGLPSPLPRQAPARRTGL